MIANSQASVVIGARLFAIGPDEHGASYGRGPALTVSQLALPQPNGRHYAHLGQMRLLRPKQWFSVKQPDGRGPATIGSAYQWSVWGHRPKGQNRLDRVLAGPPVGQIWAIFGPQRKKPTFRLAF
jgi:hypothetical protein